VKGQAKQAAQNDIIANQTKAIEKQEKKVLDLEARLKKASELPTAGGPFEAAAKADPKEIKKLKDELAKAHLTIVDQGKKCELLRSLPWVSADGSDHG